MSEQNNTEMTFQIQRIYTKDISFEAPNAPHVFQKDWQPGNTVRFLDAHSIRRVTTSVL